MKWSDIVDIGYDDIAGLIIDITELLDIGKSAKTEEILLHRENGDIVEYLIDNYMDENDTTTIKYNKGNQIGKDRIKKLNEIISQVESHIINSKLPEYKNGLNLLIAILAEALNDKEVIKEQIEHNK